MLNNNFSFWATKDDNKPDLLCGRPADYFVVQKYFTIMICATIVLGGVISFGTMFVIIAYVVLKFNEDSWDLQCCLLFSITLCIIDPFHSVNSLKTIGISKMYTDIIRGESLIICSFTCIFFGIFRGHTTNVSMFRELHVIIGLSLDIFGSTVCGYWCTRVIQIILTDLFSNTLTNVVLCFSLVYLTFYLVSPILMHSSYEYDWRWALVISWSGIRGVFSLLLAPDIYNFSESKVEAPHMFIFYIQVISLLTTGINSYMMLQSAKTLGLCALSLPRQMIVRNAIQHIQQIVRNTITLYKTEKTLTNVNWNIFKETHTFQSSHISHGPKEELITDEVLIEEARLHIAIIQMSSFEKQCNDGILGVEAARILIGATKSYCPVHGKFMSISDVSTYVRARSWLIKFKNMLTYLEYHKESVFFIVPENNRFLSFVYRIIISQEFEYATHVVTVMYIFPMIIHIWPTARELNVSALISINYYFMFLYTLESALKILILKKKYFLQNWNILDFFIIVIGIVDILCMYFVKLRPDSLVLIQFTVVMGYFRIIRFLPIFKIIIPVLIKMADVQIKKSLSLMYSITKGYVKSQEDAKLLLRQISCREQVFQKLYDILDKNKQEAIKELGTIENEGRDVVIALKTKQAILNVIAKALKNLTFLWSRGIIDRHEGIEMNKVLLRKIKALNNFPMAIPPPTPDKYLHNIIWLENKDVLIEFFKVIMSSVWTQT
ncbi:hypothetical protein A6R68_17185 [Neotoma lepida]|uniref:Ion transport domain-containing protein n=1 Tax=Neotoma lepida TaxID=56216 RepID=A0A1A6HFF9_NEOLE|nr:hypothetical protein A6R68_17185 [Neotoma lepida]